MAEMPLTPDFTNMDGLRTVVYNTEDVPDFIWEAAQKAQRESLRALLPAEDQDRADFLVKTNNFKAYRDSRVNPNLLVGNGWNDDQLFRHPKFTATFDSSHQLVGGVLTADNTSSRAPVPKLLRPVDYWTKMLLPPGVAIPGVGNKRYHHLREVFTHPDAQSKLETEDSVKVVSGIALAGIYYAIKEADPRQSLTAYEVPADRADDELTNVTEIMGMTETGYRKPHTLPGYNEDYKLVRVRAQIGVLMQAIIDMPGAKSAIENIDASVRAKK